MVQSGWHDQHAKPFVEARPPGVAENSAPTAVTAVDSTVAETVDEARPPGIAKLSACGVGTEGSRVAVCGDGTGDGTEGSRVGACGDGTEGSR